MPLTDQEVDQIIIHEEQVKNAQVNVIGGRIIIRLPNGRIEVANSTRLVDGKDD